ncbi:hypothetical protein HanRHA438_Chr13g0589211 [Helianthus annuus]|nr:hypothetical protein HanIR_Chr13g0629571 [Helianthus annuus]KAJ0857362.1 hypothetical protein HanRHA438_Chr13g0589211 [Helianthus annuus]
MRSKRASIFLSHAHLLNRFGRFRYNGVSFLLFLFLTSAIYWDSLSFCTGQKRRKKLSTR